MGTTVCSSQSPFCPASIEEGRCDTAETLREIVSGALIIASSGSLSISSPTVKMFPAPPAFARQQLLRRLPLPADCSDIQQLESVLCCSPRGSTVVQPALHKVRHSAADKQASQQCLTAASVQPQQQQPACKASSKPSVRRCLCLALETGNQGPAQEPTALPLTPTVSSTPVPADAVAVTPAAAATVAANTPGTCASCTHSAPSSRTRLQDWLGKMELQLQVPLTPLVPPEEPCPAPKGPSNNTEDAERRKRTLAALPELALSPLTEAQWRSNKRRTTCDAAAFGDPAAEIVAALGPQHPVEQSITQRGAPVGWFDGDVPPPAFAILGVLSNGSGSI